MALPNEYKSTLCYWMVLWYKNMVTSD